MILNKELRIKCAYLIGIALIGVVLFCSFYFSTGGFFEWTKSTDNQKYVDGFELIYRKLFTGIVETFIWFLILFIIFAPLARMISLIKKHIKKMRNEYAWKIDERELIVFDYKVARIKLILSSVLCFLAILIFVILEIWTKGLFRSIIELANRVDSTGTSYEAGALFAFLGILLLFAIPTYALIKSLVKFKGLYKEVIENDYEGRRVQ